VTSVSGNALGNTNGNPTVLKQVALPARERTFTCRDPSVDLAPRETLIVGSVRRNYGLCHRSPRQLAKGQSDRHRKND